MPLDAPWEEILRRILLVKADKAKPLQAKRPHHLEMPKPEWMPLKVIKCAGVG
jgi:hypothetical protein